ncbi:MAG TPA: TIGR04255 family protein [Polyangiaceae bacterium]|nr:TIGR04255 family protein [Polyangiaceae bacterium]
MVHRFTQTTGPIPEKFGRRTSTWRWCRNKGSGTLVQDQATAAAMRFQESDRVSYGKNPLVEVICQARFNRLLRLESEVPAAFQQALMDDYPKVVETNSFAAAIPPQLAQIVRLDASVTNQRAFDFVSTDGEWSVSITSQFVALTTKTYRRWEDFRARLVKVFDAFANVYEVATFTRLGLRYQDLIQRSRLGLDGQHWATLLNPQLVGELAEDGFENDAKHIAKELVFSLDFDDASVRLYHGLARTQNADESCYLIDSDFFREQPTERGNALPILDRFNREAGKLFRWAISTPLHAAMDPEPIA